MSETTARFDRLPSFMRGNMFVLTATRILGQFGRSMAFPYASLYILSLGGEPEQIGFINSLAPLATLIVFPLGGYIADHAGRVRLIGISGFFSSFVFILFVIAPSWKLLAVASFLRGFMAIQFPAQSAIIADSLTPSDRGRGFAILNSIGGAPALLAPYVAGLIITALDVDPGMRYLYGFLGLAYLVSAIVNQRFLVETSPQDGPGLKWREAWHVLVDAYCCIPDTLRNLSSSLRALALVLVLSFLSNAIAGPFWVVYAVEHIGLDATQWGLILLIETAVRNVVGIPAGILVDRHGRRPFVILSLFLALISVPLFIVAPGFGAVLALRTLVAVSNAFYLPASAALMADTVPREIRGRVMAALGRGTIMIGATGGGAGGPGLGFLMAVPLFLTSLAAGYVYAAQPVAPWLIATLLIAVCLVTTLWLVREPTEAQV